MIKLCMICKGEFYENSKALSILTQGVDKSGNICARLIFHCGQQTAYECSLTQEECPCGLACTIYSNTGVEQGTDVRVHSLGSFETSNSDLLLRMPTI